jgi:hypothetical protein
MTGMTTNEGEGDFLADPTNPALTSAVMERIGDQSRPDRLAWNTFRTLALWEPDRWVPSLLEIGLGPSNRLSGHEWDGTSVQVWATGLDLDGAVDVVLDGPEALVLVDAVLDSNPADVVLEAGMRKVIEVAGGGGRLPAFLLVAPEGDDEVGTRLERASGGTEFEPLAGAIGWLSWGELGRLALDLAEEADPMRDEQVHLLVSQLQSRFPNLQL